MRLQCKDFIYAELVKLEQEGDSEILTYKEDVITSLQENWKFFLNFVKKIIIVNAYPNEGHKRVSTIQGVEFSRC